MTQREFCLKTPGWEDCADPRKLCDGIVKADYLPEFVKSITVEECEAYLNEEYPVMCGIE